MENVEINSVEARRSFLKKVAYVEDVLSIPAAITLQKDSTGNIF